MSSLENREVGITEESEQALPETLDQVPGESEETDLEVGPESFVTPRQVK